MIEKTRGLVPHTYYVLGENGNEHNDGGHVVERRYSDFYWLRDVVLKRSWCRLVPPMPGKGNTNGRKEGLERFLRLMDETEVGGELWKLFKSVPDDFASWRKYSQIDTGDGFVAGALPRKYQLKSWFVVRDDMDDAMHEDEEFKEIITNIGHIWKDIDFSSLGVGELIALTSSLYTLVERIEKRELALRNDEAKLGILLNRITKQSVYKDNSTKISESPVRYDNVFADDDTSASYDEDNEYSLSLMDTLFTTIQSYFSTNLKNKKQEMSNVSCILVDVLVLQDYIIGWRQMLERIMEYKRTSLLDMQHHLNVIHQITGNSRYVDHENLQRLQDELDKLNAIITKVLWVKQILREEWKKFGESKRRLCSIIYLWLEMRLHLIEDFSNRGSDLLVELQDLKSI